MKSVDQAENRTMKTIVSIQNNLQSRSRCQEKVRHIQRNFQLRPLMLHPNVIDTQISEEVREPAMVETTRIVQGVAWGLVLASILWVPIGTILWMLLYKQ